MKGLLLYTLTSGKKILMRVVDGKHYILRDHSAKNDVGQWGCKTVGDSKAGEWIKIDCTQALHPVSQNDHCIIWKDKENNFYFSGYLEDPADTEHSPTAIEFWANYKKLTVDSVFCDEEKLYIRTKYYQYYRVDSYRKDTEVYSADCKKTSILNVPQSIYRSYAYSTEELIAQFNKDKTITDDHYWEWNGAITYSKLDYNYIKHIKIIHTDDGDKNTCNMIITEVDKIIIDQEPIACFFLNNVDTIVVTNEGIIQIHNGWIYSQSYPFTYIGLEDYVIKILPHVNFTAVRNTLPKNEKERLKARRKIQDALKGAPSFLGSLISPLYSQYPPTPERLLKKPLVNPPLEKLMAQWQTSSLQAPCRTDIKIIIIAFLADFWIDCPSGTFEDAEKFFKTHYESKVLDNYLLIIKALLEKKDFNFDTELLNAQAESGLGISPEIVRRMPEYSLTAKGLSTQSPFDESCSVKSREASIRTTQKKNTDATTFFSPNSMAILERAKKQHGTYQFHTPKLVVTSRAQKRLTYRASPLGATARLTLLGCCEAASSPPLSR